MVCVFTYLVDVNASSVVNEAFCDPLLDEVT
jgi:hypothetical protein